jgi:acyl-coenzyme A thioesterase PaaI-like protein
VTDGVITAKGQLVHKTRNVLFAEAELHDQQGHQVARGSGSFMRSSIPLSADVGHL